jgi:hypothetical protein
MRKKWFLTLLVTALLPGVGFFASGLDLERSTTLTLAGAYYLDDNGGYGVDDGGLAPISYNPEPVPGGFVAPTADDEGRDLGSGWGAVEMQAVLTHRLKTPFMVGSSGLTEDNNLLLSVGGALTPVSLRAELGATLTPVAFFNLAAGTMVGTGWDIGFVNGMGLDVDGTGETESASFGGIVNTTFLSATLQFDLAAVVPGEWNHVVAVAGTRVSYAVFTRAEREEAWVWQGVRYFNGLRLLNSYFLGYQMPLMVDTAGFLVETRQNLGYVRDLSPEDESGWGSEFVTVTIGPVVRLTLSEKARLTTLLQVRRKRLYDETSVFYAYYANRKQVGAYWDLHRLAVSYELGL